MLDSAKEHLDELPSLYKEFLRETEVPRQLTHKIRYLLSDIESALDYMAFFIFNKYCAKHIDDQDKLERRRKKVNFPLYDSEGWFDKKINEMFPQLISERPDIIEVFKNQQPFVKGKESWLPIFNKLVNNNKHRELEKQKRDQTTHVLYGKIGGITLQNVVFKNVGVPISINGQAVNFINTTPFDRNFIANTTIDFVFKELNLSVIQTLTIIIDGANSVIQKLEGVIEED